MTRVSHARSYLRVIEINRGGKFRNRDNVGAPI